MAKTSKTTSKCQISGDKKLKTIISLGYLPPVNKLQKIGSKLEEDHFYPTELIYSNISHLAQLKTIVDKKILFPKASNEKSINIIGVLLILGSTVLYGYLTTFFRNFTLVYI